MKKIIMITICTAAVLSCSACSYSSSVNGRTAGAVNGTGEAAMVYETAANEQPAADIGSEHASVVESTSAEQSGAGRVGLANPFVDCKTMEEAQTIAGFETEELGGLPDGYERQAIRAMEGELLELIYRNGEDEIRFRKAKGNQDISGDYNQYEQAKEVSEVDYAVEIKGNDGKYCLAVWENQGFSYSVQLKDAVSEEAIMNVVRSVDGKK